MKSTGPSSTARALIAKRSHCACERCSRPGEQVHHRKPRQMGGTRDKMINALSNLVLLCADCHRWIESNRTAAYTTGWLVHRDFRSSDVWLVDLYGRRFLLDDDGDTHYAN